MFCNIFYAECAAYASGILSIWHFYVLFLYIFRQYHGHEIIVSKHIIQTPLSQSHHHHLKSLLSNNANTWQKSNMAGVVLVVFVCMMACLISSSCWWPFSIIVHCHKWLAHCQKAVFVKRDQKEVWSYIQRVFSVYISSHYITNASLLGIKYVMWRKEVSGDFFL